MAPIHATSQRPAGAIGHQHHLHGNSEARPDKRELQFKVMGMTCAGCAAAVQFAIEKLPGVESAAISVTEGRASVSGVDLRPDEIVRSVREHGYDAAYVDEPPAPAELRSEIEVMQAQHERGWRRRAILGMSLWVPMEILHWVMHARDVHAAWVGWVLLAGATFVFVTVGSGFYRSAWNAAKRRSTNMDTLIAMGATAAYIFSLVVFIGHLSGWEAVLDQPLYFAESSALLAIISLGHWFEARASARAGSAVRELLQLQPDQAEIIEQERPGIARPGLRTNIIQSADVKPGDRVLIRPGGRIPVDGEVVDGASEIDESVVTGESMPIKKSMGDSVVAGSMNTTGTLTVQATVDGRHTTVARIADMVQRAQTSKANIQRLADRVSAIFVPVVLTIALVTIAGWWIAGDFSTGVISAVTVLIISCPCALGLATPMAVMVGAGAASKRGILIKSAGALEIAGRATHVIFDKTGTLTRGQSTVTSIELTKPSAPGFAEEGLTETELLRLAAAVESPSEHPIARAIIRAAHDRNISVPPVRDFHAIPGQGVRGIVEQHQITVIRDEQTTCRVEVDGNILGRMTIADDLRPDAKQAVAQLRAMGLGITMLSGDRRATAEAIGLELGLNRDHVVAEATPERKVEFVRERAKPQAASGDSGGVVMVGDGINDAAALAQADLGIAIASGTNIAIESADVVIPSARLIAVPETLHLARQTLTTIKQNLFFAFFYNVLAIPAAALGLLGLYGPIYAAAAMGLSDITVIGNAIRLRSRLGRRS